MEVRGQVEKWLQTAFSRTLSPSAVAISINSPGEWMPETFCFSLNYDFAGSNSN